MTSYRLLPSFLCAALMASAAALPAQTGVTAVLPNGREIHPAGNWIPLAPYPFALAVRQDGRQIAVPSIGFPFALNVISGPFSGQGGAKPAVLRIPAGKERDPAVEVHAGLGYSADGTMLYVATGESGKIRAYRTSDWKTAGEMSLDGPQGADPNRKPVSFAATLVVSADGRTLYALDQGNWRIVILDAATLKKVSEVATGNYPFGLALSPDGARLYVTNTGLFEYSTIPGASEKDPRGTGLHFPPFGYPSKQAREGTVVEGRRIPGLGDENSDRGSSLWTYDVHDREHPALTAKLRLGAKITEGAGATVGGAAPTGVATADDAVYVSLAHDDSVAKISADGTQVLAQTELSPFTGARFQDHEGRPLRGVMPSGLALHGGRIYLAESGIDAVGVVDAASMQVVEHIPVGWNPSAVGFSPDGQTLYVVNKKGRVRDLMAASCTTPMHPLTLGRWNWAV